MFGIGIFELLIIFVVLLLTVGPEKLPMMARKLAKLLSEFRKASNSLKSTILNHETFDMISSDGLEKILTKTQKKEPKKEIKVAENKDG